MTNRVRTAETQVCAKSAYQVTPAKHATTQRNVACAKAVAELLPKQRRRAPPGAL